MGLALGQYVKSARKSAKMSAMALYKNGSLLFATHVSLGPSTPNGIFLTGFRNEAQQVLDYRKSMQYDDAPMSFSFNIIGGVYAHAS